MQPICDLLLKGGHLIDPLNDLDGPADVAIKDGTVAAVGPGLEVEAARTVELPGLYVFPGLIDIHVHVYGGYIGWLFPDQHALPYGVTTVVDTGGSGWKDVEEMRRTIVEPSATRVLAFLNIVGAGMTGAPEQDVAEMDPKACAEAVGRHRDFVVGTKAAHFGGPGWESAGGAIEAARLSDT
ncbi:MAG: amidohydrolase/deacetylase family metallohydrolase, partial [Candidatus Latescibacterota bacterium]